MAIIVIILFLIFSFGLVLTNNILLSLVGVGILFLIYTIFLFSIKFYYLAFTIGIIYLGAIIILFIYVIMLINLLTSNYNTLNIANSIKQRLKFLLIFTGVIISFSTIMTFFFFANYDFIPFFLISWKTTFINWYSSYYLFIYDYTNFTTMYLRLEYMFLTLGAAIALFLGLIASIILVYLPPTTNKAIYYTKFNKFKQFNLIEKRTTNNMFIQTYRDLDYTIYITKT